MNDNDYKKLGEKLKKYDPKFLSKDTSEEEKIRFKNLHKLIYASIFN